MKRDLRGEIAGCLRVAGSVEEHLRGLRKFRPRDWEKSLNWLHLSGIALMFWDRLQKLGAEDAIPPKLGEGLAANLADHRLRVAAMMEEFDSLNRQFDRAGIEYAVWKGFALFPHYCPDACLRPTYDYDYLISGDTHTRAQEVIQAAGYVRKPDHRAEHHVTFARPNLRSRPSPSSSELYAADLPRKVELHRGLWDRDAFLIPLRVPERILERKLRRTWQNLSFCALSEDDALVFQALHTFQHILHNWCRLGWLWEIAYFLEHRSADTSFWSRFCALLEGNEPLVEVVGLVMLLAAGLFHAPFPAPIKGRLLGAMRSQVPLWVDHYGLPSALNNFSENKYALFLYREFLPDKAAWRAIRGSRLFPLHRPNRIAGAAAPSTSASLPVSWKQGWYVLQRLLYHSVTGARYAWESARWERIKTRAGQPRLSSI